MLPVYLFRMEVQKLHSILKVYEYGIYTNINDAWNLDTFTKFSIHDYTSGGDKSISFKFFNSDGSWYELYFKPYKDSSTDRAIYLTYYKNNSSSRTNLWKVIPTWLQ